MQNVTTLIFVKVPSRHYLLHYAIKEYYQQIIDENKSIEDFEEIAKYLSDEFFGEYEPGMTPLTLAYLQDDLATFNVSMQST